MIEIIEFAKQTFIDGEQAVTLSTWALTFVTALDAKVGARIYTRVNILINILSGKVGRKQARRTEEPTPEARPTKTLNGGHYYRA
jgi:hypothetical protein